MAVEPVERGGAAGHVGAEVAHEPAQHLAVARQVVARDDRQRPRLAAGRAQRDAAGELGDRRARRTAGEVGGDIEVVEPEAAGGAVAGVAALGDGQRDHVHAGVGERLGQPARLARSEQDVADRRVDGDDVLLRPAVDDAEEPVLRDERIDRGRPALRDAEDAPVAARALDRLGGVDGLVGAVEGADPQVDDADGRPLGEDRPRTAAEPAEGRRVQPGEPTHLSRSLPTPHAFGNVTYSGSSRRGAQPERHVRRLHRLVDHAARSSLERVEVDLVAQPRAEAGERPAGVVAAAVEAAVDAAWMRARAGPNSAATASVEAATAKPDRRPPRARSPPRARGRWPRASPSARRRRARG